MGTLPHTLGNFSMKRNNYPTIESKKSTSRGRYACGKCNQLKFQGHYCAYSKPPLPSNKKSSSKLLKKLIYFFLNPELMNRK